MGKYRTATEVKETLKRSKIEYSPEYIKAIRNIQEVIGSIINRTITQPTTTMTIKDIKQLIKDGGTEALKDEIKLKFTRIKNSANHISNLVKPSEEDEYKDRLISLTHIKRDLKEYGELERALQKHLDS